MIGFIVPARNEESNIQEVISSILFAGGKKEDIFIIDNSSIDSTAEIALSNDVNVHSAKKVGYQSTIDEGFRVLIKNKYTKFCIIDGDNEIDKLSLKQAINLSESYDLIIGKRAYVKRMGERSINFVCSKLYGIDDLMCGLKVGDINYYNPNNNLGYGIDLLKLKNIERNNIFNLDIILNSREETRLGNVFKVNAEMFFLLIRFLVKK
tara:strand:- start:160 stop:783 length:624 start_codon:yes stop_codon:yes gene_type:complete